MPPSCPPHPRFTCDGIPRNDALNVHVGRRIRKFCKKAELSIKTLADELKITPVLLETYLQGTRSIPASLLAEIAFALQCDIEVFFENLPAKILARGNALQRQARKLNHTKDFKKFCNSQEARDLAIAYSQISDRKIAFLLKILAQSLSENSKRRL